MFTLLNDVRSMDKLIGRAITAATKSDVLIHEAAFNAIAHVANTGDVRPLQRLHDGMPARIKLALGAYAAKFCPRIKYDHKAGSFGVKRSTEGTDFGAMQEVSPLAYVPVKAARQPKAFNLRAEIEALVRKASEKSPDASKAIGLLNQALKAA